MQIKIESVEEMRSLAVMVLDGDLDATNFKQLIAEAQKLYSQGTRKLILDLSALNFMSSSGLVALHGIAKIFRGEGAPDLDSGWAAIHAVSEDRMSSKEQNVKLVNPQPKILSTLQKTGMDQFFAIFSDRDSAVNSYQGE